jgi:hypothetical protein
MIRGRDDLSILIVGCFSTWGKDKGIGQDVVLAAKAVLYYIAYASCGGARSPVHITDVNSRRTALQLFVKY